MSNDKVPFDLANERELSYLHDSDEASRGERTVLALVRVFASLDTPDTARIHARDELEKAMAKGYFEEFRILDISVINNIFDLDDMAQQWRDGMGAWGMRDAKKEQAP